MVSASFVNHDGAHKVRRGTVRDITNIPEGTTILLQKRGEIGRLPDVSLLDMRLQKDFKLGDNVRFSVFADALNLTEQRRHEGVQSTIATSSVFTTPFDPVDPRRLMLGAKLRFYRTRSFAASLLARAGVKPGLEEEGLLEPGGGPRRGGPGAPGPGRG